METELYTVAFSSCRIPVPNDRSKCRLCTTDTYVLLLYDTYLLTCTVLIHCTELSLSQQDQEEGQCEHSHESSPPLRLTACTSYGPCCFGYQVQQGGWTRRRELVHVEVLRVPRRSGLSMSEIIETIKSDVAILSLLVLFLPVQTQTIPQYKYSYCAC